VASRSGSRRGPPRSGITKPSSAHAVPSLPNIEDLIDEGGQITVGHLHPIACVAVANDESDALAMLRRRPDESLQQLLERLDAAIGQAWDTETFIDEINRT
jgi:hypothetical protein